ncbi:MAG: sigma-70 family RNA polymerase sigma factor [Acidimicrobiia bacterium]|nr:sigma-70 family RNA polymerase sigma factor [Acidimicrobiia bacterium]
MDITDEQASDPALLDATYRTEAPTLLRVAYLITGSRESAEDAVHDTFLRCRDRLAELDHPPSYLRAAVVNECRSAHRRAQRGRRDFTDEEVVMPSELVELRDALDRLPWRQRTALVLRYFVDLPDAEIAMILDCRPSTVRSHLRRGLSKLKESFQ